jgi:polyisoprenoid-binding protein YceI
MQRSLNASLFFGLLIFPTAFALPTPIRSIDVESASRLWVKGTSSVRAWECQAPVFTTHIAGNGEDALGRVLAGEKAIDSVTVSIPSATLDCRNGTMTGHMKKAIKVAEFDSITFAVKTYTLAAADSGMIVTLDGSLTLGGVTKDVTITATAKAGPEGMVQLTGKHELSMKDYGLKAPSLMLGTMKVHDKVTVGFDLLLKN